MRQPISQSFHTFCVSGWTPLLPVCTLAPAAQRRQVQEISGRWMGIDFFLSLGTLKVEGPWPCEVKGTNPIQPASWCLYSLRWSQLLMEPVKCNICYGRGRGGSMITSFQFLFISLHLQQLSSWITIYVPELLTGKRNWWTKTKREWIWVKFRLKTMTTVKESLTNTMDHMTTCM